MALKVVVTKKNGDIALLHNITKHDTVNNWLVCSGVSSDGKSFSRTFDWWDISDLLIIEE